MEAIHESMIEVAEMTTNPLAKAVYGTNFWRGPADGDGSAFFVGEDLARPVRFSLIGEVKDVIVNEKGPFLIIGRPTGCSLRMKLFWRQQICSLERIELEDINVDQGLRINPRVERWINDLDNSEDRMWVYPFVNATRMGSVDQCLQTVASDRTEVNLATRDLVHCRVALGCQADARSLEPTRSYYIFAISVDRVQVSGSIDGNLDQWQSRLFP
ncbi:hypothetical protein JOM56_015777 [Amanita muscaria]